MQETTPSLPEDFKKNLPDLAQSGKDSPQAVKDGFDNYSKTLTNLSNSITDIYKGIYLRRKKDFDDEHKRNPVLKWMAKCVGITLKEETMPTWEEALEAQKEKSRIEEAEKRARPAPPAEKDDNNSKNTNEKTTGSGYRLSQQVIVIRTRRRGRKSSFLSDLYHDFF